MTDAMQTIRFALDLAHKYVGSSIGCMTREEAYLAIALDNALTALDSLAVAQSESAIELAQRIEGRFHQGHYADDYNAIAALIQSRDNRIHGLLLQELKNIANAKPHEWGDQKNDFQAWAQSRARHAIAKTEATNGQ